MPIELVVAEPERLGTELVRATGSPEWVAQHEPLPDAADEEGVFEALGLPFGQAQPGRTANEPPTGETQPGEAQPGEAQQRRSILTRTVKLDVIPRLLLRQRAAHLPGSS